MTATTSFGRASSWLGASIGLLAGAAVFATAGALVLSLLSFGSLWAGLNQVAPAGVVSRYTSTVHEAFIPRLRLAGGIGLVAALLAWCFRARAAAALAD